jgi:hypothetical protein
MSNGRYDLVISKSGFSAWAELITVEPKTKRKGSSSYNFLYFQDKENSK